MVKDLRGFIAEYEKQFPSEVCRVSKPINCKYEIPSILKQLGKMRKHPLLIFEKPVNANGNVSKIPVTTGLLSTRERIARAIGSTYETVGNDLKSLLEQKKKPVAVDKKDSPCKKNVEKGSAVDLFELPILTYADLDPGPYVTHGWFTSYDPDSGVDNMGLHRGFVASKNELRVFLTAPSHSNFNTRKYEAMGKDMKCAYWIGHHPAVLVGAQTKMGYPESHYEVAGAVAQEPIRLTSSESLGDDFMVPADAEIVIEGVMKAGVRKPEGPFGEYTRYFGPQRMSHVMEVTCITHRDGALWDTIAGDNFADGGINTLGSIQEEAATFSNVKRISPSVTRVFFPESSGCGRFYCYIQIKKLIDGPQRDALLVALATTQQVKFAIVVDDDIDIYDEEMVWWAVATRTQWDKDVLILPEMTGAPLDPSIGDGVGTKVGIDATKPVGEAFSRPVTLPKEYEQKIRLGDYIPQELLQKFPDHRKSE